MTHNWNELFEYKDGLLYWKTKASIYSRIKIGDIAGCVNKGGYRVVSIHFKKYQEHRIVWEICNGEIPSKTLVDHRNGNKTDNRSDNLRLANISQNTCNQSLGTRNKSGFKGVCWGKRNSKWIAQICVNGKVTQLGAFDTKEEAYAARVAVEKEYHGEFAQSICRSA